MNVFPDPLSPPQPSREEKLQTICKRICSLSYDGYRELLNVQKDGIRALWNHPEFTPQEIVDALGDKAVKIFNYHGKITTMICEIAAVEDITPDILLPPNAFTVEGNVITITEEPYIP